MKKILFFEIKEFTGATRVTRTLAKAAAKDYQVAFAQVGDRIEEDIEFAIEEESPDILFSSFISINPFVIEIGKRKTLRVIIRNDYKFKDVPLEVRNRAVQTYFLADEIIDQTEEMRQELIELTEAEPSKVIVIENPLDKEEILLKASEPDPFKDNGKFHFLWVGRKDPIKDLPTLQKAFDIVHSQYPDTDLTLISDDPNPYRWMKHADCLVISSISEASPNVLREAIYLGTKVISSDCSPTVRKLLPKENICPISNPEALADMMVKIIISVSR